MKSGTQMKAELCRYVMTAMIAATGCDGVTPETSEEQSVRSETQFANNEKPLAALNLTDGFFSIRAKHSWQCLDVLGATYDPMAPIVQHPCHGGDNQRFRLEDLGNGYYRVGAVHSWQCLDVLGATYDPRAPIVQHPCHGGDNQQFRIE